MGGSVGLSAPRESVAFAHASPVATPAAVTTSKSGSLACAATLVSVAIDSKAKPVSLEPTPRLSASKVSMDWPFSVGRLKDTLCLPSGKSAGSLHWKRPVVQYHQPGR